jgi:ornithine decarboxylase
MMTFDSIEELEKVNREFPEACLILRIKIDESLSDAMHLFNNKFGASMEDAELILQKSKDIGMQIRGISFHVGSGGGVNFITFKDAIFKAKKLFKRAK